ncbi:hypothetical protein L6452_20374 [Arctium lappa]|uniref:Uncharacterized protein n=1 Tax=Arctium lappa TaxID=4217 RepID=A0ACB9BBZ7_ARCLA|nr:hypothetical protein L6452_20374 [Arctium lappa]
MLLISCNKFFHGISSNNALVHLLVDSALATELGIHQFVYEYVSRAKEIVDTMMALFLGLLRCMHLLSHHALSAPGWLGSVQPQCRGMRRCRGLVLGIIAGESIVYAERFSFTMYSLSVAVENGKLICRFSIPFPPAVRRMDILKDLLAESDLISLHCDLTYHIVQILNADCFQYIEPVKQLLLDGTLVGCALVGAIGPQWMGAWVHEIPNVLLLPCSADYSEEAWMEIREKAVSILQTYFLEDVIPTGAVSDIDEEESETIYKDGQSDKQVKGCDLQHAVSQQLTDDIHLSPRIYIKTDVKQSMASQNASTPSDITCSRSGKELEDTIDLRSFIAGGKLLQTPKRLYSLLCNLRSFSNQLELHFQNPR